MKDFPSVSTPCSCSGEREIKRGRVIATPVNNINLYYVDPGESDFARAGLVYTTSAAVGANLSLIGFHSQGNYSNATSESYALLGMTLFAEYADAIAVIDVDSATHTIGSLTVTAAAGASGHNKVTVAEEPGRALNLYKVKVGSAAATVSTARMCAVGRPGQQESRPRPPAYHRGRVRLARTRRSSPATRRRNSHARKFCTASTTGSRCRASFGGLQLQVEAAH